MGTSYTLSRIGVAGLALLGLLLTACTSHDYRHRIETTYQGHRYIYYCDTVLQDKEGLYFKNSNGSIIRIRK